MKLSEALARAKRAVNDMTYTPDDVEQALCDLIESVEETLLAQKKEADLILDLADLRRWGGSE